MKKLIGILAISFIACSAYSQDNSAKKTDTTMSPNKMKKDCFYMKDGKMMSTSKGESTEMTQNIHLKNGTTVKTDGVLEMSDGSVKKLKDGQYIDVDGYVGTLKKMK